jgi:putative hydrolase of the HAD superfamily
MPTSIGIGNREIKAVIFDMDNTLFDFVEAKLRACKAVVEFVNRTDEIELLEYFLKDIMDIENPECIARFLRDNELYDNETYEKCKILYETVKLENIVVYEGVIETLERLKETALRIALVTDALKRNATERLKKTELSNYFELVVTFDMVGKKKPAPDSIEYTLKELGVPAEHTVLVGDSLARDIKPARKLGLVTVYAAYGDRNYMENRNYKADFVIKDIRELWKILQI